MIRLLPKGSIEPCAPGCVFLVHFLYVMRSGRVRSSEVLASFRARALLSQLYTYTRVPLDNVSAQVGNWQGCRERTDEPASRITPYRPVVSNLSASYCEKIMLEAYS